MKHAKESKKMVMEIKAKTKVEWGRVRGIQQKQKVKERYEKYTEKEVKEECGNKRTVKRLETARKS